MADFDPLAGTKMLHDYTMGMQRGNDALSRLTASGGIQDLLARRENVDRLGQIDKTNEGQLTNTLTQHAVPTAKAASVSGVPDLTGILDAVRNSKTASQNAGALQASGAAGYFPKNDPATTLLDIINRPLQEGEPTGAKANRAYGEAVSKDTKKQTKKIYRDPKGNIIPGITEETVEIGAEDSNKSRAGGPPQPSRTQVDSTPPRGGGQGASQIVTKTIKGPNGTRQAKGVMVNGTFMEVVE